MTKKQVAIMVAPKVVQGADGKWYEAPNETQPEPKAVAPIVEATAPAPQVEQPKTMKSVSFKSGMGWIIASFLSGALIVMVLFGR